MLTVDEMLVDLDMTGFDGTDLPVLTPEDVAELVAFDRVGQLQDGPSKTPKGNFQELLEAEHQRKAARRLEREREAQERRDQKCRASTRERVRRHRAAKAAGAQSDEVLLATLDEPPEPLVPRNSKQAYHRRKGLLLEATGASGNKFAEQLRGRESLIAKIWLVRSHNPKVSDGRIAELIGLNLTKRRVQGYREIIAKLEAPGGIWHGP